MSDLSAAILAHLDEQPVWPPDLADALRAVVALCDEAEKPRPSVTWTHPEKVRQVIADALGVTDE